MAGCIRYPPQEGAGSICWDFRFPFVGIDTAGGMSAGLMWDLPEDSALAFHAKVRHKQRFPGWVSARGGGGQGVIEIIAEKAGILTDDGGGKDHEDVVVGLVRNLIPIA